jgi:hypothetical protein
MKVSRTAPYVPPQEKTNPLFPVAFALRDLEPGESIKVEELPMEYLAMRPELFLAKLEGLDCGAPLNAFDIRFGDPQSRSPETYIITRRGDPDVTT